MKNVLDVVLCWHMHQPWYRLDGRFVRPWVYLHALKDYADMAAHLELQPKARAVVNFSPVLLDQLALYTSALRRHLADGAPIEDPLLDALTDAPLPEAPEARAALVRACLAVDETHVLGRFEPFRRLVEAVRALPEAEHGRYLSDSFLRDLLVWFHLAWFGEHARRTDPRVGVLLDRGGRFEASHRRRLLELIAETVEGVVPRWRRLAEAGQVELAMSPWGHPILPLLVAWRAAREASPGLALPEGPAYPGGTDRAGWHVRHGLERFEAHFGRRPAGCWPSEGALSETTVELLAECGFAWTASGGSVLQRSLAVADQHPACVHRPFTFDGAGIRCFFRDDGLSDLIGFSYRSWDAGDAVADLVGHLERIADHCQGRDPVVAIVLDGENAWEHYPENGYGFLTRLYQALVDHPRLHPTTFSDHLERGHEPYPLGRVVAGSWVHGHLETWIGAPGKNRAWTLLAEAKRSLDAQPEAQDEELLRLLGACEGSDWAWWFDGPSDASVVGAFDALYRGLLAELHRSAGLAVPAALDEPLAEGVEGGGVHAMLRGG